MKSNTLTIIKKEFARFFGDRQLLFTTVIMPGLLIYLIYSMMGNGIGKMVSEGAGDPVTLRVEHMPKSLEPILQSLDSAGVTVLPAAFTDADIKQLEDNDLNTVLVRFPNDFDQQVANYDPQSGELAPNIKIYYNSTNNASQRIYTVLENMLSGYESMMSNRFDVNRADTAEAQFDMASEESIGAMIWSKILPMMILIMLFSGMMAIAPSAIAGEKERGTIATLLVTPMKRNDLALGKIVSLSCIGILSGLSSFIGIVLSLPKMINLDNAGATFHYTPSDYVILLLVILSTVLIMSSVASLLSALAKDVKNAGTMMVPGMLVVMVCGLIPMFQGNASTNFATYLIPFYNSTEVMVGVFMHEAQWSMTIVCLCANVVYTAAAVWGLTRMFNSEKIMFSR